MLDWSYFRRYALPLGAFFCVMGLWTGIVHFFEVASYIFPAPADIADAFAGSGARLWESTVTTFSTSVAGLGIAAGLGFVIAVLFVRFQWMEQAFMPYVILTQTTPIVAVAPLIVLWAGSGLTARAIVSALICFFPIVVNSVKGFRSADRSQLELLYTYSAQPRQEMAMLRFPAALPDMFAALRISATLCVVGSIVAELVTGNSGLGFLILQASYSLDTPLLFAAVLCAALMGVGLFLAVAGVERLIPHCRHGS